MILPLAFTVAFLAYANGANDNFMNPGQGCAANLSTALLGTTASLHGLPVSTTHVSVGGLLGMGTVTNQAKWRAIPPVLASWVVTLPVAASLSATFYQLPPISQS